MNETEKNRADLEAEISRLRGEIAPLHKTASVTPQEPKSISLEELITRVSTDFINVDVDQIDTKIVEALGVIGEIVCVDRSYLFVFSPDRTTMDNTHEWCRKGVQKQMHRLQRVRTDRLPWFSKQILAPGNVVVPNVSQLPPEAAAEKVEWESEDIKSLVCVPMVCRGAIIGFVGFDCVLYTSDWSEPIVTILQITGNVFANLLDRKHTEDALRKSEETYRTLVDNLDLGVTLINTEHRIEMANQVVCKLFNKPLNELIGGMCYEQFEKRSDVCSFCPGTRALKTGSYADAETYGTRDDGSRFPVQIRAFPLFYENGEPRGFIEVVKDLTREKLAQRDIEESRRMLQIVLDNIPVRVFWKDRDSVFLGCNRLFSKDAGLDSNAEIVGRTDYEFIWKAQADLYRRDDAQVMSSGQSKVNYEEPQTGPDGTLKWLRTSKVPLRDLEGIIIGVLCTYEDITAQKLIEQERLDLLNTLSIKNEELESIVYITSHDLRSPLVNIEGFSQELENSFKQIKDLIEEHCDISKDYMKRFERILEDDIPESLRYIHSSTSKMDGLLKALLQLSRQGQIELKITRIDMNQLIRDICRNMQFQITGSNATVTAEDMPDCMGDPGQVGQVFTNLLDNAIKYLSPDREGRIRVTGKRINGRCVYCIEDNGIGIAKEHQSKVFEIFHRLAPSGTVKGEGIGLTSAKRMLARQNGRIWLESEPGAGSRFYVELPAAESHS